MAGLFGGGSASQNNATAIGTLNLQTSCYGNPIPWAFGTARVSPNLIQYEDFASIAHTSSQSGGGKGGRGGSDSTTYTYTAAMIMALVSGPIAGVTKAWKDKDVTSLAKLSLDLYPGTATQSPYPYMQTKHPDRALSYRGISYVAAGAYDLGSNATMGNHSFEVQTSARIQGLPDTNVADVIKAILTDTEQGLGLPATSVGDLTQFSNFCLANGIWVSPVYKDQQPAFEYIKSLLQIGFADCYRSAGVLNIVPYSDSPAASAYGEYVPSSTAPVAITEDDILDTGDSPIVMTRKPQSESFNHVQVKFSDRADDYNDNIAEAKDQADIEVFGIRSMAVVEMKEICDVGTATKVAEFLLHRSLYIRNEYEFSLPWKFCYLEPMDLLALYYPRKGHDGTVVLITEITEDEDGMLTVKAEDYPLGTNRASTKTPPTTDGYTPDFSVDPGNATVPVIFEAPLQLTNNVPQIWMAAAGGANWGGCDVWVSTDDASYQKIGRMQQRSRYGTTTSALAAGAAIDTVSLLSVDLNVSAGTLISGTQQNAQDMITRCYVGGEYLSYATATLTGVNKYHLSYLVRGGYGSDNVAHPAGVPFVRLDDGLFTFDYPKEWMGKTVYIKLVSFNAFGGGLQDMSTVMPTVYTIVGAPLGVVQNLHMATAWSSGKNATVAWDALAGADAYDVQVFAGSPAVLVRSITGIVNNQFTYTPQDMRADGGPWRAISVNVRGRAVTGAVGKWATILANNPQIGALTNIRIDAGIRTGFFKCTPPGDEDFAGIIVWISTDPTCPATDGNKVYDGQDTFVTISKLGDGITSLDGDATYYVRAAAYDTFGKDSLTISSAIVFTAVANAPDANSITAAMIKAGVLDITKFASGLQPVGIVNSLPAVAGYTGPTIVTLTTDGKLYRLVGGVWTAEVKTTDLAGQLTDAQLSTISAAKVSGQLVSSQIAEAAITADKLGVVLGGGNLTPNSSFESVQGGANLAAGWSIYNNSGNVPTYGALVPGRLSGAAQKVYWSTNNDGNTKGIFGSVCQPGWQRGKTYVLSFYATTTDLSIPTAMGVYFNISPVELTALLNPILSTEWQRYAFRLKWGSNVEPSGRAFISITSWLASVGNVIFDDVQVTDGDVLTGYAPMVGEILPNAVASLQLAAGAVTSAKTAIAAIDPASGNLTANSVTAVQIAAGAVTAVAIQAGSITGDRLAANTIGANQIEAGSITGDRLKANTVTANQLAAGSVTAGSIAAGAITTPALSVGAVTAINIAAGSVTANAIAANSITTAAIQAGAIQAAQIAAGAITASKLSVTSLGSALNRDPNFTDPATWIVINGTGVPLFGTGTAGFAVAPTYCASASGQSMWMQSIELSPIDPARTYRLSAQLFNSAGNTSTVYLAMQFYSANGNSLWTSWGGGMSGYPWAGVPSRANDWEMCAGVFGNATGLSIPAGAKLCSVGFILNYGSSNSSNFQAIQNLRLEEVIGATLIQDGAITTQKITAAAITGDKVAANAISTVHLSANSITANQLSASSVTAAAIAVGSVTARAMSVTSLSAISANLGQVTAGDLYSTTLHGGGGYPHSTYSWPTNGGDGYHLSSTGLLLGNANNGKYFQILADGNVYAPGMSIVNGVLTISQANVINTLQIANEAVTLPRSAASSGNTVSVSIVLDAPSNVFAIGCVTQPNTSNVLMTYQTDGGAVQTAADETPGDGQIVTIQRLIYLQAGTTTVTYSSNGGMARNANIILIGCKK